MTNPATCESCEREGDTEQYIIYESPWAETGTLTWLCGDCMDNGGDFSPWFCEWCERDIVQRNPANGWRCYFQNVGEELVCVRCIQRYMMQHGHTLDQFEGSMVHCDFYNYSDLEAAGFHRMDGGGFFIPAQLQAYQEFCIAAIKEGSIILTDLVSSGMGLEGSVDVWRKEEA